MTRFNVVVVDLDHTLNGIEAFCYDVFTFASGVKMENQLLNIMIYASLNFPLTLNCNLETSDNVCKQQTLCPHLLNFECIVHYQG